VTVNTTARKLTATDASGLDGLELFYNGTADASGITINVTNGLASNLFSILDDLLDATTGVVQNDINSLTDQNETANDRVTAMQDRLAIQKQILTDKFNAMEVALAKNKQIQDSITQIFDSLFQSQNQKN
jgi:flagellar capping protein FliD